MKTRLHSIGLTIFLFCVLSLVAPGAHGGAAIAASRWVPVGAPAMIYAQDSAHSVIVALSDGGALLMRGSGQPRTVSTFVERYVPATGRWVAAAPLPTAGAADSATLLPDGRVLVVGGFRREALLYDPANDSWTLTVGPRTTGETHAAALLPSGRVLVVGPFGAEVYDPVANAWTATSPPNTQRFVHSLAVVLPDGRVLVAGGFIFKGTHGPLPTSSADIYDPRSNAWTLAEPMHSARGMIGGTLMADGRVLVIGGGGHDASAEIYDPATGLWTPTRDAPPFIPSSEIKARGVVSLLDGSVLILADSWTGTPVGNCPLTPVVLAYEPATGVWREAGGESFDRGSTNRFLIRLADGTPMVAGGGVCRGDFAFFPPIPVPALLLPPDPLRGMLFNSYRTLLGREPARPELDAWADHVGRECGADRVASAVATILGSHEFRALRQLRPADLPSALYRATLLRGADAPAIDALRAHFQGVRTTSAVDGFLHSGEGRTVVSALLAGSLARDGYVRRVYEELLGRPPEAEALSEWTSFIDSDHAVGVFVRTILTSAEFEARPATLEGFIVSLYRGLLLRPPFDAERDAWTSAYAQAVLDVATGSLLPSQEFGDLAGRICREE